MMNKQFLNFVDRIGINTGKTALCEAIKEGYRVCCEAEEDSGRVDIMRDPLAYLNDYPDHPAGMDDKQSVDGMRDVWFRLGGYLRLTDAEIDALRDGKRLGGDEIAAILGRGVRLSGETYPWDEDLGLEDTGIAFETDGIELAAKR